MKNTLQGIKNFCDSAPAGIGSLLADEKWVSSHCRRVGGPFCSGRIESRYCGVHRDEEIKIRFRGGEPLNQKGLEMII
jgi:hypothetical protein